MGSPTKQSDQQGATTQQQDGWYIDLHLPANVKTDDVINYRVDDRQMIITDHLTLQPAEDAPTPKEYLCIYHASCNDGGAARAVISLLLKDRVDFYGTAPSVREVLPDLCRGRKVIFVDLVSSYEEMNLIYATAEQLFVIDHHKTAPEATRDIPDRNKLISMDRSAGFLAYQWAFAISGRPEVPHFPNGVAISFSRHGEFDLRQPVTLLSDNEVPLFLHYIDDRDRFQNVMPGTKEFSTYLFSQGHSEEMLTKYETYLRDDDEVHKLIRGGEAMTDYSKLLIEKACKKAYLEECVIDNVTYVVILVNSNEFQSDIGNLLLVNEPRADFSAVWYAKGNNYIFSLRSLNDRADVSKIAKYFGGGGHRNASGCRTNSPHLGIVYNTGIVKIKKVRVKLVAELPVVILNAHPSQYVSDRLLAQQRYLVPPEQWTSTTLTEESKVAITVARALSKDPLESEDPEAVIMWYVKNNTTKFAIYGAHQKFCQAVEIPYRESDKFTFHLVKGQLPSWIF